MAKIPELAAELWRRVRPHFHPEDVANVRIHLHGCNHNIPIYADIVTYS